MKTVKRSVAVVVRRPGSPAGDGAPDGGEFLIVRRPEDPDDPLAGAWGLPAVTLLDGEDERAAVVRAGWVKLGVELAIGGRIGEKAADRGGYQLRLADYEATVVAGVPAVPQPDESMTQYTACRYTADPAALAEAAARGSLCAQVFLEDNSKKRSALAGGLTGAAPGEGEADVARTSRRRSDNSKERLAAEVRASATRGARDLATGDPVGESRSARDTGDRAGEVARVRAFRERIGVHSLIDVHTHFMPERLLAAVRAYFDAAGPLLGRPWPIVYREDEQARVAALRSFGVSTFTAMLYPHKPGMARSLNDWGADFAARTPDCLHTATLFAEPSAADDVRRALGQGARVFKCHLQVGDFDPNDPLLDDAWGQLAEAGVPVVTHCGSGPVAGRFTGPGPIARLLARHPRLRLVVAHLGMPEYAGFFDLAERYDSVLLDTTMAFTPFIEDAGARFPKAELPRLRDLGDRVLLGTDFPNIPYSYPDALAALEGAGLGTPWLRSVCHDNAARIFAR